MPQTDVLALVLGGGVGARLYPLTKLRAKPAVPIGGRYRLIDIPLSNCLNSGLKQIYILTQYNSVSLHRHIAQTYKSDIFSDGWLQILAAEQTPHSTDWYQGTADAVRKQLSEIRVVAPQDVLILSGDHLYRMDYMRLIHAHRAAGADVTSTHTHASCRPPTWMQTAFWNVCCWRMVAGSFVHKSTRRS